jgi:hypothetical protein
MMKKYCLFALMGFCGMFSVNVSAGDVPEIYVYGSPLIYQYSAPPSASAPDWLSATMNMQATSYSSQAYAQMMEALKAAKKAECEAKAEYTGQKCKGIYQDLQPVCAALTMYMGARLGTKFWEKVLGSELDSQLKDAIAKGIATGGLVADDAAINCTLLTNQAMTFCEAGAKKMKAECAK